MEIDLNKIEDLKKKIPELKSKKINEAQTKEWLIRPFFETLGWDFSSPYEVSPEDDDSTGKKPDYIFFYNNEKMFLVEAKPLSNPLTDEKMIKEKINYCSNSGVPFLVITNGEVYKVFYTEIKGTGNEKLLFEFSITNNFDLELAWKLSKDAAKKNELETFAKTITKHLYIKTSLEKLIQSGNSELVHLINREIKNFLGFYLSEAEIISSLKNFSLKINQVEANLPKSIVFKEDKIEMPLPHTIEPKENKVEFLGKIEIDESKYKLEVPFKNGEWKTSLNLFKKFVERLDPKDFPQLKISPTNWGVSFWKVNSNKRIAKVEPAQVHLRFYYEISSKDIPMHLVEYVWSDKQYSCILKVTTEEDFDKALELLKIAYKLN